VLVGQPDDPEWREVINEAEAVMREVRETGAELDLFSEKAQDHRRGRFLAIPVGVSFGGGQTVRASANFHGEFYLSGELQEPGNLVHTKEMRQLVKKILKSHSIQRIAGFQSSRVH
jgi:hypothetical protein